MSKKSKRPVDEHRPTTQATDPENDSPEEPEDEQAANSFLFFNLLPSWMVSFLLHIAIIVILAIIVMQAPQERQVALEVGEHAAEPSDSLEINLDALDLSTEDPFESEVTDEDSVPVTEPTEMSPLEDATLFDVGTVLAASESNFDPDMIGELSTTDLLSETSSRIGTGKAEALREGGGNAASESAVALALKWIVDHQLPDGGWNFDHQEGPGNHRLSPDPGGHTEARAGATAMALLPLLGSGQTHLNGQYQKNIRYGLDFLKSRADKQGRGISYHEPGGTMYSHGLAAIVLCEAYAMTKDPELAPYAQGTIWYVEDTQDPVGGGWRYSPKEPGDTSVVGWQVMALKSAKISGLDIKPKTFKLTEKFLDSVSSSRGAYYGYLRPTNDPQADSMTAAGLLCRMYMGWGKDNPGIVEGVSLLTNRGPDTDDNMNMYYNYYATQVVKHYGGQEWKRWNVKMRDHLIESQHKDGVETGSWTPDNGLCGDTGGRLYMTSMCCMTLEIYYRYLPLYGDSAANDEFPLE